MDIALNIIWSLQILYCLCMAARSVINYFRTSDTRLLRVLLIYISLILENVLLLVCASASIIIHMIPSLFVLNRVLVYFYISEYNIESHLKTNNKKRLQLTHIASELCVVALLCILIGNNGDDFLYLSTCQRIANMMNLSIGKYICCIVLSFPIIYSLYKEAVLYKTSKSSKVKYFCLISSLLVLPIVASLAKIGIISYIYLIYSHTIFHIITTGLYKRVSADIIYDDTNNYLYHSLQLVLNNDLDINSKGYLEILKSRAVIISHKIINLELKEEEVRKFLYKKGKKSELLLSEIYNCLKTYYTESEIEEPESID